MAQKLWKNILDNPQEEKFRTVRSQNDKIKAALTKHYNGMALLKLCGFQEHYDN